MLREGSADLGWGVTCAGRQAPGGEEGGMNVGSNVSVFLLWVENYTLSSVQEF